MVEGRLRQPDAHDCPRPPRLGHGLTSPLQTRYDSRGVQFLIALDPCRDNSAAWNKQGQTRGSHPLAERIRFESTIQQPASLISTSSLHSLRRIRHYWGHSFYYSISWAVIRSHQLALQPFTSYASLTSHGSDTICTSHKQENRVR